MGKYEPLGQFLRGQRRARVPMTFAEIERVLKSALPASKRHRAWWSNNPENNVMTRAWLDAGFETESVDVKAGKLVFRRAARKRASGGKDDPRHPMFGYMKGMVTFTPDYVRAKPGGGEWGDGYLGEDVPD